MQNKRDILDSLPIHSSPRASQTPYVLRIDGLVACALELSGTELQRLTQQELIADFSCEEGWTVPNLKWQGPALKSVLAIAKPHPEANWIQASAGAFSVPISLEVAPRVLLATQLGGRPVPPEHGGPVRLVLSNGDCWTYRVAGPPGTARRTGRKHRKSNRAGTVAHSTTTLKLNDH